MYRFAILVASFAFFAAGSAAAASLSVTPIGIERIAPAATAALTLRNTGDRPINVQVRVFRWRQSGGDDVLEKTGDVVVSPPMTSLAPGVDYTVRVVRVAGTPVAGEESYRVLVDELPDRSGRSDSAIQLVVRYSIPAFFRAPEIGAPDVAWHARTTGGRIELSAANSGATRLKAGRTVIRDGAGRELVLSEGLLGYVLAGAARGWSLPAGGKKLKAGAAELEITSDGVTTNVPITLRAGG